MKQYVKAFLDDETIKSVRDIQRRFFLTSKEYKLLKLYIKENFDEEKIYKIQRSRIAKYANKVRKERGYSHSEKTRERMRKSQREFWDNLSDEDKDYYTKIKRDNMSKCLEKSQTPQTKKKRVKSRKNNGTAWHTEETKQKIRNSNLETSKTFDYSNSGFNALSEEQKIINIKKRVSARRKNNDIWNSEDTNKKISETVKLLWSTGVYTPSFQSKGHLELFNLICELGYNAVIEHRVNSERFDIYVEEYNLLIEFNGTYWHADPRFYDAVFEYKEKDKKATDVWDYDYNKKQLALNHGYNVEYVWQYDWENSDDKEKLINNIFNKYNE